MAHQLGCRINRDAIFVIKPVQQFFGGQRGIKQFMVFDSVEQSRAFTQSSFSLTVFVMPSGASPDENASGDMPPSRGRCWTIMAPARQWAALSPVH